MGNWWGIDASHRAPTGLPIRSLLALGITLVSLLEGERCNRGVGQRYPSLPPKPREQDYKNPVGSWLEKQRKVGLGPKRAKGGLCDHRLLPRGGDNPAGKTRLGVVLMVCNRERNFHRHKDRIFGTGNRLLNAFVASSTSGADVMKTAWRRS